MSLKSIFVIVLIVTTKSIFSLIQKLKDHSVGLMMRLRCLIGQFHDALFLQFLLLTFVAHFETEKVKITIITTMNC